MFNAIILTQELLLLLDEEVFWVITQLNFVAVSNIVFGNVLIELTHY